MKNYQNQLPPKSDMLIAILKGMVFSFMAFTFVSGFIFTVIPLSVNVANHIQWHIIDPVNAWVALDPAKGTTLLYLLQGAGVMMIMYLLRNYIAYLLIWIEELGRFYWLQLADKIQPLRKKSED